MCDVEKVTNGDVTSITEFYQAAVEMAVISMTEKGTATPGPSSEVNIYTILGKTVDISNRNLNLFPGWIVNEKVTDNLVANRNGISNLQCYSLINDKLANIQRLEIAYDDDVVRKKERKKGRKTIIFCYVIDFITDTITCNY
jgi:hypothetical protein